MPKEKKDVSWFRSKRMVSVDSTRFASTEIRSSWLNRERNGERHAEHGTIDSNPNRIKSMPERFSSRTRSRDWRQRPCLTSKVFSKIDRQVSFVFCRRSDTREIRTRLTDNLRKLLMDNQFDWQTDSSTIVYEKDVNSFINLLDRINTAVVERLTRSNWISAVMRYVNFSGIYQ